jgi:hypothetical protein
LPVLACASALTLTSVVAPAAAEPEPEVVAAGPRAEHDAYVLVHPDPVSPVAPSSELSSPDGDWYGHWQLLAGAVLGGLYTLSVYGTHHAEPGKSQIGAAIGTGYLLGGFAMSGAGLHAAFDLDDEEAALLSAVTRLTLGIAGPSFAALACTDDCATTITATTAGTVGVSLLFDAFVLSWD